MWITALVLHINLIGSYTVFLRRLHGENDSVDGAGQLSLEALAVLQRVLSPPLNQPWSVVVSHKGIVADDLVLDGAKLPDLNKVINRLNPGYLDWGMCQELCWFVNWLKNIFTFSASSNSYSNAMSVSNMRPL